MAICVNIHTQAVGNAHAGVKSAAPRIGGATAYTNALRARNEEAVRSRMWYAVQYSTRMAYGIWKPLKHRKRRKRRFSEGDFRLLPTSRSLSHSLSEDVGLQGNSTGFMIKILASGPSLHLERSCWRRGMARTLCHGERPRCSRIRGPRERRGCVGGCVRG